MNVESWRPVLNIINIENAAFGPTVCAERVALFKAVSEGVRSFEALAVVLRKLR